MKVTRFRTVFFFILILIIVLVTLSVISNLFVENGYRNNDFVINLLVEAHGVIGDLIIFGVLISLYDIIKERKSNISRWNEEIDDFRFWYADEAKFRISGIIRRMQREGYYSPNLSNCLLEALSFSGFKFKKAVLEEAKLSSTNFKYAIIDNCNFRNSDLSNSNFESYIPYFDLFNNEEERITSITNSDFSGADLSNCNLRETKLVNVKLVGAKLENVKVENQDWDKNIEDNLTKEYIDKYYNLIPFEDPDWAHPYGPVQILYYTLKKKIKKTDENNA